MKNPRRIGLHLLFWTVYFGVNLFNELYLSPSFSRHPSVELFLASVLAQLLVLCIKVPAVYYVLYSLIPRWAVTPARRRLALEFVLVFCGFLLCYRGLVQYVIRPFVYREASPPMTGLQHIARFFYSLLDLLQVTGIAAAIRLFRLRISALVQEKALMREKLQSEMQHLRAQINPHFLFNTLNSIYALSRTGSGATPDVVMRLSRILRYTLYASEQKTITMEEELKTVMDYIELQQIRFGSRVRVHVSQRLDDPSAAVTPLVLMPLVENAFKHGTTEVTGLAEVWVRVALEGGHLDLQVRNTLGTPSPNPAQGEGIGLANMRRRLELLYRDYSFEYGRWEDKFVVELNINLASYADLELPDH